MSNPSAVVGEPCPTPIIVAVHGTCNALEIELLRRNAVFLDR